MKLYKHLQDFNSNKHHRYFNTIYLSLSAKKDNIELSYKYSWLNHSYLSAKRKVHLPLDIILHGRKEQSCPTHAQTWVMKTKMTPSISVYTEINP